MRVTICQILHSLTVGGAEVLADRLARAMTPQYRFVFACLDELGDLGEGLRQDGFPVEVFHRRPGVDMGCARRLSCWWRSQDVQLVHAHQYTPFFYAMAARGLKRRPPVLFTEHGRWLPDYPRRKRIIFNRLTLRKADRVVGVGNTVRHALIKNEGIPARRVGVIYNGVDCEAFSADGRPRDANRIAMEIGAEDFVVLQVARLDHLKDHLTAVRAIARLAEAWPHVRLVLVGEGPERDAIEQEVQNLGMEQHVRLLGLRQDVAQLLHAADVFLLSSISEGIPVTLIEAMAARLPIVSTDVGGVPEVVVDGETGMLSPAGDHEALADALIKLAENDETRGSMGEKGRQRAVEVFSQRQMHAAYANYYEEMLHGQRST